MKLTVDQLIVVKIPARHIFFARQIELHRKKSKN